jgi:hypothetical protein
VGCGCVECCNQVHIQEHVRAMRMTRLIHTMQCLMRCPRPRRCSGRRITCLPRDIRPWPYGSRCRSSPTDRSANDDIWPTSPNPPSESSPPLASVTPPSPSSPVSVSPLHPSSTIQYPPPGYLLIPHNPLHSLHPSLHGPRSWRVTLVESRVGSQIPRVGEDGQSAEEPSGEV